MMVLPTSPLFPEIRIFFKSLVYTALPKPHAYPSSRQPQTELAPFCFNFVK